MKKISLLFIIPAVLFLWGCGNSNDKNKIEASGTIEATEVTLSAQVSGKVKALKVNEGEKVTKGDTLLLIDNELLNYQLNQAEAGVEIAKAQYNLLKKGARAEDVKQAEDMYKQAEVNLNLSKVDKERNDNLYKANSISKKQFDDMNAKYEIALAQYNSAKENLIKMKNLARPEELKQAEGNLNRQIAAVNILKKNIGDSYVTAPINGFIVKKFVEVGETVAPLTSLMMLSDLTKVKLVIYVSEEELGKVKLGQKADITVDAFPQKTFVGRVIYISPEAEFTPKNIQTKDERTKLVFAVKVEVANPSFELKVGMPADAAIIL